MGDTHELAGTGGYWCIWSLIVWVPILFSIVDTAVYMLLYFDPYTRSNLASLVIAAVMYQKRQQLRLRLGAQDPARFCCADFLFYWCCSPCVTTQEARQVDSIQGVHMECCCKLVQGVAATNQRYAVSAAPPVAMMVGAGQIVGQPVGIQQAVVVGQVVQPGQPVTVVQATEVNNNVKEA
jgi:hypothetical protein